MEQDVRSAARVVLEGLTSISALLGAQDAGVNDRPIFEIWFDREKKAKKAREYAFLYAKCKEKKIALIDADAAQIAAHAEGNTHGGMIAFCGTRQIPSVAAENLPSNGFLCLLDGIEDPYNFGYALRSLYAAGCDGVLLGKRNWMSAAGVVARASAGASEALAIWQGEATDCVALLRSMGYRIACAGIRNSVGMYDADLKKPLLLIVGGEKRGISASLLALCDEVVRIDYGRSFRGSLSAASAATVLAFEVLRQNK